MPVHIRLLIMQNIMALSLVNLSLLSLSLHMSGFGLALSRAPTSGYGTEPHDGAI